MLVEVFPSIVFQPYQTSQFKVKVILAPSLTSMFPQKTLGLVPRPVRRQWGRGQILREVRGHTLWILVNLIVSKQEAHWVIVSSPEPKAHWWAYGIGRPLSSVGMCVCLHFQTSLKPLGQLKPVFMWSRHGTGEWKFVQMVQVTWPIWPPCPYMVKTLKNLLLWNQKADDLETYAASSAQVLTSLFKWWPWVDIYLFLRQGQICSLMRLYGNTLQQ